MTMHPTLWDFTRSPCAQPQARPTLQISFLTVLHRRIIWSSSQLSVRRRPSLRSNSVSDRNHTPLSGALSQVCVLENVSCNHQHVRNNRCARLTIDNIAILSPNHRPKPPPSTLTLTENDSGRKPIANQG
jgi:hypothetical protein